VAFTTAVFYDIENLLKGYAFSAQVLSMLSLRDILDSVNGTGRLSAIAVQRAYANWSDPRLGVMRGEINELGIEPVQVFGLGRDQKKNAADIQLAIDAIDLAHVRPSLEVFVIVSGDGGFAALAKKLHEYGKTVVGCAYQGAANRVFRAVCDEFVPIADPEDTPEGTPGDHATADGPQISTPLVHRMARTVRRAETSERAAVVDKAKEVLRWIESDAPTRPELAGRGLNLSVVGEAIRHGVPDFDPARVGFAKFVEFLQYICTGTSLHVLRYPDGTVTLACRSDGQPGAEVLPDLPESYLHSAENYRSLLGSGGPVFRLPDAVSLDEVARWLAQNPPRESYLGTIIERVTNARGDGLKAEAVKRALLCFVAAGVFDRRPEGVSLGEQKLTLDVDPATGAAIVDALKAAAREKLWGAVGEVREAPFDEVFQTGAS